MLPHILVLIFVLILLPATGFAQTMVPTWEQHETVDQRAGQALDGTTTNASNILQILKGLQALEGRVSALETPPAKPPIPPVKPPTVGGFAELCTKPGVLLCEDFETDLAQANKNRCAAGNDPSSGLCPMIQSDMVFEGNGSLQLTTDGGKFEDVSGIVSFPFPALSTGWTYANFRMRFGDGILAFDDAGGFPGSKGVKWWIWAGAGKTCNFSGGEVVASRNWQRIVSLGHSCAPGVRNDIPPSNFDLQPKVGQPPVCRYSEVGPNDFDNSACVDVQDGVWHNFEQAILPAQGSQRGRVKLWLDGVLVIDWISDPDQIPFRWVAVGPYNEIFFTNYQTGFNRAHPGQFWRIWYDNLIVSTNCITSC